MAISYYAAYRYAHGLSTYLFIQLKDHPVGVQLCMLLAIAHRPIFALDFRQYRLHIIKNTMLLLETDIHLY